MILKLKVKNEKFRKSNLVAYFIKVTPKSPFKSLTLYSPLFQGGVGGGFADYRLPNTEYWI